MTVSLGMGPSWWWWWVGGPSPRSAAPTDRTLGGSPGVRAAMRRPATILLPAVVLLAAIAAAVPAAHARVMLVATGQATATLLDVQSGALVARVPVPGGTRAVAVAPDGVRGYVTAGAGVAAIDLNARAKVGDLRLTGTPTALALSATGNRLVAARRAVLDVIDPATLTVTRSVSLGAQARRPGALAVSADGAKAVVVID